MGAVGLSKWFQAEDWLDFNMRQMATAPNSTGVTTRPTRITMREPVKTGYRWRNTDL